MFKQKFLFLILKCLKKMYTLKYILLGYEPAGLTVHPPPQMIEGGFIFLYGCLVSQKFFPQRKSGFCRRYSPWNAQPLKPNFNKAFFI